MSKIDEMLKNEKVEWKKLGNVCEIKRGKGLKKNDKGTGDIPAVLYGELYTTYDNYINEVHTTIDEELSKTSVSVPFNSILMPISSTTKEAQIGKASVLKIDGVYLGSDAIFLHPNEKILSDYLMYVINSFYFEEKKMKNVTGTTIRHLDVTGISKIKIPIPSLETQEKIAKTLDKFTNYVTELQSELQSRNKQYEYYRDKLLSEEHLNKLINKYDLYKYELKETTLGEVIKLKNGRDWKTLNEGDIPVYGSGGSMNIGVNKFSYDKETVLIPRKGSIDNIFYLNEPFWNVDTIYYTEVNTKLLNVKYFYYFMKNIDLISLSINPTRPSLTQEIINNIKITLPPIEIQAKIAEILDKFQALTQYVSGLLPEEIEEREKQYEYYREKLLTFDTERTRGGYQLLSKDYISLLTQAGDLVGVNVFELEKKKLEEVCEILDSKRKPITKSKRIKGIYPYYGANGIQDCVNDFIFDGSFVLMGEDGSVIDKNNNPILHWVNNKKIWVNNHAHVLKNKDDFINLKYIYYSLSISDVSSIVKGTPPKINQANLRNIKMLIPPKAIQEYIVSILDKFEALSQSTTEGLRREIELREKQYEYYREKLLTFEK